MRTAPACVACSRRSPCSQRRSRRHRRPAGAARRQPPIRRGPCLRRNGTRSGAQRSRPEARRPMAASSQARGCPSTARSGPLRPARCPRSHRQWRVHVSDAGMSGQRTSSLLGYFETLTAGCRHFLARDIDGCGLRAEDADIDQHRVNAGLSDLLGEEGVFLAFGVECPNNGDCRHYRLSPSFPRRGCARRGGALCKSLIDRGRVGVWPRSRLSDRFPALHGGALLVVLGRPDHEELESEAPGCAEVPKEIALARLMQQHWYWTHQLLATSSFDAARDALNIVDEDADVLESKILRARGRLLARAAELQNLAVGGG